MNRKQLVQEARKEPNIAALSRKLGIPVWTLRRMLDKQRIPRRSSNFNGGKTHNADGYILVFVGKGTRGATAGGYVYEHRHVMEQHLGRSLRRNEHVHHQNENKADNRIENLEIVTPKQHRQEHREPDGLRKDSSIHRDIIYSLVKVGANIRTIAKKVGLSVPTVRKMVLEFGYFTCPVCGRDFSIWKALGVHFQRSHPRDYQKVNS